MIDVQWLQEQGVPLFCTSCGATLNENNWSNHRKDRNDYVCKKCETIRWKNWAVKNKKKLQVSSLDYYIKNIEQERKRRNNVMLKLKTDCMNTLGGKCADCGNNDIEVLTVEHLKGKGLEEYRKLGHGHIGHGKNVLYRLIRDRKVNLEDYLCLCINCNMKRRISKEHKNTKGSKYHQKLKQDVITILDGRCAECGIDDLDKLTLEHNNGFGKQHLFQLNNGIGYCSKKLYALIRRGLEPTKDYSVLCFNHNFKSAQKWREKRAKQWRKY